MEILGALQGNKQACGPITKFWVSYPVRPRTSSPQLDTPSSTLLTENNNLTMARNMQFPFPTEGK
jgi:hypothetical protein